jgi:hypothetical protein
VGGIFGGQSSYADTIKQSIWRIESDDTDRRIARGEIGAEAFGIFGREECADLNGEKAGARVGARDDFETDVSGAGSDHCDGLGGGEGEVNNAIGDERAAIVDADGSLPAVIEVGDAHDGVEGQGAVGCGHVVHFVDFAVGGAAALEGKTVPGGDAFFDVFAGNGGMALDGGRRAGRRRWSGLGL